MKHKIIVIPFILPWNRSADYQRQTCFELAKQYKVIVYMQRDARFFLKSIFTRETFQYPHHKNVLFYRPLYYLPFRRFHLIENMNQRISYIMFQFRVMRSRQFILWVFDPFFHFMPKLGYTISIYDCVDFHSGFHKDRMYEVIQQMEKRLIKKVDYFFVNSHILYSIHMSLRKPDGIVPQGFHLDELRYPIEAPINVSQKKSVIGYVGALDNRLDFLLLTTLIRNNPQWIFVLWGSVTDKEKPVDVNVIKHVNTILRLPNVITGKSIDRREIGSVIQQFTIGIIPHLDILPGVKYSYPMKLFEYFYMGKPVLSTEIEELKRFPEYVRIGKTMKDWEKHINDLISKPWPDTYRKNQRNLAVANSFTRKIHDILTIIHI
jgi:glycosyltransferase involved in cell wall biosynthesis